MDIKVSIIVPVYNVEPYIRQCLDSLVNQTLREIEIILINDCSPDNCGTICTNYAAKDERIIVINNNINMGQGESSNIGIRLARGEYIGFVDADDWVDLGFFKELHDSAVQNNADVAKAGRISILEGNNERLKKKGENRKIKKRIKQNIPVFLTFTYQHTTAIYKKDLLVKNKIYYPDILNAQDNVFLLKVGYFAQSVVPVSNTYYYYRRRSGSASSSKNRDYFDSMIKFLELSLVFINTHEMEKAHYDAVFIRSFNLAHKRYVQLCRIKHLADYRQEYLQNITTLITQYKYNHSELLESFVFGFRFHVVLKNKWPWLYALVIMVLRRLRFFKVYGPTPKIKKNDSKRIRRIRRL